MTKRHKQPVGRAVPLKINDGRNYHKNPRVITEGQFNFLREALIEFGDLSGVVHDLRTNQFVGGNQRSRVFSIDEAEIEIIQTYDPPTPVGTVCEGYILFNDERYTYRGVYWDDEKIERANLIANKAGGTWDFDLLANTFDTSVLLQSGFTPQDLSFSVPPPLPTETLGIGIGAGTAKSDNEEEPEPPFEDTPTPEPVTRYGDLYELRGAGPVHRILCADNRVAGEVERLLNGDVPVLMVTDPPYGVNYDPEWRNKALGENNQKTGKIKNDDIASWRDSYALFPGNVAYVWHGPKQAMIVLADLEKCGFELIATIIWVKQHFVLSRGDYHNQYEPCFYVVRKGTKHNWQGARDQSNVWFINNNLSNGGGTGDDEKAINGAQKPLACMRKPMENNSQVADLIYDPFLGSGTSVIAGEQSGRPVAGMDINPAEIDRIVRRFLNYCSGKDVEAEVIRNGQKLSESDLQLYYPNSIPT